MPKENKKDSLIAAAVTFAVALAILLLLFYGSMTFDRAALAAASVPEIAEDEELFIEPEILAEAGEPEAVANDEPAPTLAGEPELAETENKIPVVPGENPKPALPKEKPVTQKTESPVKATEPPAENKERQKATSKMAGKFNNPNGSSDGKTDGSGSGGTGVGINGQLNGRKFISCDRPKVALQNKVVVVVNVTVNAAGHVTSATARSRQGNATTAILKECERAARTARWNEDPGTPSARGSITFTITPK